MTVDFVDEDKDSLLRKENNQGTSPLKIAALQNEKHPRQILVGKKMTEVMPSINKFHITAHFIPWLRKRYPKCRTILLS